MRSLPGRPGYSDSRLRNVNGKLVMIMDVNIDDYGRECNDLLYVGRSITPAFDNQTAHNAYDRMAEMH